MVRRNGGFIGTDGLDAPDPPTGVAGTAGNASVSVAFTAPTDAGTSAITGFVAQVSTNDTAYSAGSNTGTSSPIVVSSLTNDTAATAKVWAINAYGTSAPSNASASFTPSNPIALFMGGGSGRVASIDRISMISAGDATDFGDLRAATDQCGALSSKTRGLLAGGRASATPSNVIEQVTFGTTGSGTDFGDLTVARRGGPQGVSSTTRGVFICGRPSSGSTSNVMDYVTIASAGDATDFGDANVARGFMGSGGASNGTRGVTGGGELGEENTDSIEYITIANTGNGTDFGNLSAAKDDLTICSNTTRGIFFGGRTSDAINVIEYITIANTGNVTDFGNLTSSTQDGSSAASSTLAICGAVGGAVNIDQVTIATTGNATDFGDLLVARVQIAGGCSNAHGGL